MLFSFAILTGSLRAQEWELQEDEDGIKVYTREVDGYGMPAFKGVGFLPDADIESFVSMIKDTEHSTDIYPNQERSVMIMDQGDEFIIHAFSKAIWPLSGRDGYYQYKVERKADGSAVIRIETLANYAEEEDDYVRLDRGYGHWKIVEKGGGLSVEYVFVADAGGAVPMWLKESVVTSTPIDTIKAMREKLTEK